MSNTSERSGGSEQSGGLVKYGLSRTLVLFLVLFVGSYSMIAVMNRGGELDRVVEAQIKHQIYLMVAMEPEFRDLAPDKRQALADELVELELERRGMNQHLVRRNFIHLWRAVTLDSGRSQDMVSDTWSRQARAIVAERLQRTALLLGTAMVLLLLISFFVARAASRRPGRWLDRLVTRLASCSALPAWFFGIFLILIFASALRDTPISLPWGGMVGVPPPPTVSGYVLSVLRHMILPVASIVVAALFAATYWWRTLFVRHWSDEQVEPAGAGESAGREVDRRSFLRPTPHLLIKHFLVLATGVFMGSIVLEVVFRWPGLGYVLFSAIQMRDTAVVLGALVIYGYVLAFLAVMVFFLDFLHVRHVLRRVRMGEE